MEDVTFYITKEHSWHQESFKDIMTYLRIGPNGEAKIKSWREGGSKLKKIKKGSLEWMGIRSTVYAENKIRTSTDADMGVFGGLGFGSSNTFCFCLSYAEG